MELNCVVLKGNERFETKVHLNATTVAHSEVERAVAQVAKARGGPFASVTLTQYEGKWSYKLTDETNFTDCQEGTDDLPRARIIAATQKCFAKRQCTLTEARERIFKQWRWDRAVVGRLWSLVLHPLSWFWGQISPGKTAQTKRFRDLLNPYGERALVALLEEAKEALCDKTNAEETPIQKQIERAVFYYNYWQSRGGVDVVKEICSSLSEEPTLVPTGYWEQGKFHPSLLSLSISSKGDLLITDYTYEAVTHHKLAEYAQNQETVQQLLLNLLLASKKGEEWTETVGEGIAKACLKQMFPLDTPSEPPTGVLLRQKALDKAGCQFIEQQFFSKEKPEKLLQRHLLSHYKGISLADKATFSFRLFYDQVYKVSQAMESLSEQDKRDFVTKIDRDWKKVEKRLKKCGHEGLKESDLYQFSSLLQIVMKEKTALIEKEAAPWKDLDNVKVRTQTTKITLPKKETPKFIEREIHPIQSGSMEELIKQKDYPSAIARFHQELSSISAPDGSVEDVDHLMALGKLFWEAKIKSDALTLTAEEGIDLANIYFHLIASARKQKEKADESKRAGYLFKHCLPDSFFTGEMVVWFQHLLQPSDDPNYQAKRKQLLKLLDHESRYNRTDREWIKQCVQANNTFLKKNGILPNKKMTSEKVYEELFQKKTTDEHYAMPATFVHLVAHKALLRPFLFGKTTFHDRLTSWKGSYHAVRRQDPLKTVQGYSRLRFVALGDDFGIVSNEKKRIDVWMGKGKLSTKPQQQDVLALLKEDPSRLCERRFLDQCLIACREQTPPDHTPTTDCETVRWQLLRGDLDLEKGWRIFWESKELSPLERIEVAEHTLNALSLKPLPNDPKQLAQMLEMSTHVDWIAQPSRTKQWIRETLHPHIKEQQTAVTNHWLLLKGKALTTQVDIDHLTADTCLPEKIQSHPHYKQLFGTANPQCTVNGIPNQTGVSFTFKIGERTFRILSHSDALHFEQILTFENGVTEVYRWQEAPTERFFKERGVWLNREKPTEGRTFLKHPIEILEECFITTDSSGNLMRTAYNGLQLVESLDFPAILPKEKMLFWRHPHSKAIHRIDFGSHSLERDAVDKHWKMGEKELLTGLQRAEVFRTFFADVNAEEWSFELTHKGEHEFLFFPFPDKKPLSLSYHQENGIRGSADAWLALAHRFIQKDIPDKAEQCLENALAASKPVEHRQKLFTLFDTLETAIKKGQLLKAKCLLFLRDDQLRDEIAQPNGAPNHPEWKTIDPKTPSKPTFQLVTEEEVMTTIQHALTSWQEEKVNDFSPKSVRTHFFALWNRIIAEGLKPHDLLELYLPADPTTHLMQRTLLTLATKQNGTQIDHKAIDNLLPHRYTDKLFSYPTRQRIEHLITACQVIAESPSNPNPENKISIKLDKLLHARTITRTHTLNEQEGEPKLTPESYRAYLRGQLPKMQADRLTKYLRSKKNPGTNPTTRHELFFEAMTKKSKPFEVTADLLPQTPAIPFDTGFPQTEPHWEVIPGFDSTPLKEAFQKNVSIKPENIGQLHQHYFALMQHKSVLKKKLEEVFPQFEMQLPALKERYKRLELEKGHKLLTAWFFYETALKTYTRCIQSYLPLLQELKEKHTYPNEPQWVAISTQIKHELDYAFNYTRFAAKTDLTTACQIVAEAEAGRELTPDALTRLDHPPVTVALTNEPGHPLTTLFSVVDAHYKDHALTATPQSLLALEDRKLIQRIYTPYPATYAKTKDPHPWDPNLPDFTHTLRPEVDFGLADDGLQYAPRVSGQKTGALFADPLLAHRVNANAYSEALPDTPQLRQLLVEHGYPSFEELNKPDNKEQRLKILYNHVTLYTSQAVALPLLQPPQRDTSPIIKTAMKQSPAMKTYTKDTLASLADDLSLRAIINQGQPIANPIKTLREKNNKRAYLFYENDKLMIWRPERDQPEPAPEHLHKEKDLLLYLSPADLYHPPLALPPGDAHLLANAPSKQELVRAFSSLPQLGHTHFVTAIHLPTPPADYPTFIQNAHDESPIPTLAY